MLNLLAKTQFGGVTFSAVNHHNQKPTDPLENKKTTYFLSLEAWTNFVSWHRQSFLLDYCALWLYCIAGIVSFVFWQRHAPLEM